MADMSGEFWSKVGSNEFVSAVDHVLVNFHNPEGMVTCNKEKNISKGNLRINW